MFDPVRGVPATPAQLLGKCQYERELLQRHVSGARVILTGGGRSSPFSICQSHGMRILGFLASIGGAGLAAEFMERMPTASNTDVIAILMQVEEWCQSATRETSNKEDDPCGKWLYDKARKGATFEQLRRDLAEKRKAPKYRSWPELNRANSVKRRIVTYAERNGLPPIEKRRPGAPRKK